MPHHVMLLQLTCLVLVSRRMGPPRIPNGSSHQPLSGALMSQFLRTLADSQGVASAEHLCPGRPAQQHKNNPRFIPPEFLLSDSCLTFQLLSHILVNPVNQGFSTTPPRPTNLAM